MGSNARCYHVQSRFDIGKNITQRSEMAAKHDCFIR